MTSPEENWIVTVSFLPYCQCDCVNFIFAKGTCFLKHVFLQSTCCSLSVICRTYATFAVKVEEGQDAFHLLFSPCFHKTRSKLLEVVPVGQGSPHCSNIAYILSHGLEHVDIPQFFWHEYSRSSFLFWLVAIVLGSDGPVDESQRSYLSRPKPSIEIVLARYGEDTSWALAPSKRHGAHIRIYNKGTEPIADGVRNAASVVALPNVGQCISHLF